MRTNEITNTADVINSRDVIDRIEELESERADLQTEVDDAQDAVDGLDEDADNTEEIQDLADTKDELAWWDEEYGEELTMLQKLAEEGSSLSDDWQYGATLIRESYFVEYCQELVVDRGDLPDNLRADYTKIDFNGVTYLTR